LSCEAVDKIKVSLVLLVELVLHEATLRVPVEVHVRYFARRSRDRRVKLADLWLVREGIPRRRGDRSAPWA